MASFAGGKEVLKRTFRSWADDDAPRMGASLAFYTVLSLAPLMIIVIAVAGMIFGEAAATGQVMEMTREYVGLQGAAVIQTLLQNAESPTVGTKAILGLLGLFMSASIVFAELQKALNKIWKVDPAAGRSGLKNFIIVRLRSFALIFGVGLLLMILVGGSLVLSAAEVFLERRFAGSDLTSWVSRLKTGGTLFSFLVFSVIFGAVLKAVPDADLRWRDTVLGGVVTAVLFLAGNRLISGYLASNSTASVYGAAGSLVFMLLWVYYSTQIFFLGAEFTHAYSEYRNERRAAAISEKHTIPGNSTIPGKHTIHEKQWASPPETASRVHQVHGPERPGPSGRMRDVRSAGDDR